MHSIPTGTAWPTWLKLYCNPIVYQEKVEQELQEMEHDRKEVLQQTGFSYYGRKQKGWWSVWTIEIEPSYDVWCLLHDKSK